MSAEPLGSAEHSLKTIVIKDELFMTVVYVRMWYTYYSLIRAQIEEFRQEVYISGVRTSFTFR